MARNQDVFATLFFESFKHNPAIRLEKHETVKIENDYGVDGKGINAARNECAVQVKYRSNPYDLITYADIARTYTSARLQFGMELNKPNSIFILTSANNITPSCKRVMGDIVQVINKSIILKMVDKNKSFWGFSYSQIEKILSN